MTDWFLSHTTHSSFNPQLLFSLVHPSVSESWSECSGGVGVVGTVEKVFCVCRVLCKGYRSCHVISNSFSIPSSTLTKSWHSSSERLDHLRISSLTPSTSSDQSLRTFKERCSLFLAHAPSVKVAEFSRQTNRTAHRSSPSVKVPEFSRQTNRTSLTNFSRFL